MSNQKQTITAAQVQAIKDKANKKEKAVIAGKIIKK